MRLLAVTHFFEAHGGGIERVAGHLNRHLTALGHAVDWAASDEDPLPDPASGAPIPLRCAGFVERLCALPMPIPGLSALRRLRRAVSGSDAVIIHDSLYLTSIAAMIFARAAGRPALLVQHIAKIPFRNPIMMRAMDLANAIVTKPLIRAADQVVYISATTQEAFASVKLRRPATLHFNGVDASVFFPSSLPSRKAVLPQLGLSAEKKTVLFVGRFVAKKGLAVLEAFARLRPDVQIIMAGRGPLRPESWHLPNVTVVRDRSGYRLAELYRAADAFMLPSHGEGYPLVVQEALACGLPVLCDEGSAKADPAAQRWTLGLRVDPSDPQGTAHRFSKALDALRVDVDSKHVMAAYAHAAYSWSAMAGGVAEAIATCLHPAHSERARALSEARSHAAL